MRGASKWYERYLGWLWKHKVITAIIVLFLLLVSAVTSGGNGSNQNTADNQAASTDSSQQQANDNTRKLSILLRLPVQRPAALLRPVRLSQHFVRIYHFKVSRHTVMAYTRITVTALQHGHTM